MTATSAVLWRKEVRELLPWWAATVVTMVSCWALMRPDFIPIDWLFKWALEFRRETLLAVGLCAYAAGAVTLGALSLGQEYAHQTLPALLTHPVSRGRILMVKLTVLTTMLAVLGALAFGAWGSDPILVGQPADVRMLLPALLPLASSLLLAPWLTMVARSALGGAVFAAVLPAFLWMAGASFRIPVPLLWTASVALGVLGAAMTWRTFMRLEVAGSSQSDIDLSDWFSRSKDHVRVARTQNAVWLLVKKEFRLQQATFVVSSLYIAVWLMMVADRLLGLHALTNSPMLVATFVNTALVPLLCGALASAGERQLGVVDWQTLLPIAAWRQWAIKAGVALGMAFALAVVLPTLLASIAFETGWRDGMEPATVVMLCVAALYVSTLSTNGLRALLLTAPAIAVTIAAVIVFQFAMGLAQPAIRWVVHSLPIVEIDGGTYFWWRRHGWEWAVVGFAVLLLVLGYHNHRMADRSPRRVARQLGWLSAYVLVAGIVVSLVSQLFYHWLRATGGR